MLNGTRSSFSPVIQLGRLAVCLYRWMRAANVFLENSRLRVCILLLRFTVIATHFIYTFCFVKKVISDSRIFMIFTLLLLLPFFGIILCRTQWRRGVAYTNVHIWTKEEKSIFNIENGKKINKHDFINTIRRIKKIIISTSYEQKKKENVRCKKQLVVCKSLIVRTKP